MINIKELKVGDKVKKIYDDGAVCRFYVHDVYYADIGGWLAILYFEKSKEYSRTINERIQHNYYYAES